MTYLFLRYLRFLLFNPKPMNQQEGTERTEMEGQPNANARFRQWQIYFSVISVPSCSIPNP